MDHWLFQAYDSLGVDNLFTIIGLSILALQDIKYGEIHYRYLLLIAGFSYLSGYILIVLILIGYQFISKYIGGADLLIFSLLVTQYGYLALSKIMLVASLLGILHSFIYRRKQIRFIPHIFVGTLCYLGGIV